MSSPRHTGVVFVTASVVFVRSDGAILTVRKRGTHRFMLPGGKLESGELAIEAARREAAEEIGVDVAADQLAELGWFSAPAANEPGAVVETDAFVCRAVIDPVPAAEIEELRWHGVDAADPGDLAPLLTGQILPALRSYLARSAD